MGNGVTTLLEAISRDTDKSLNKLGHDIGRLYTDQGFPVDMALSRLDMSKEQKLAVLNGALEEVLAHKRRSDAGEKAIERTRKSNREAIERFLATGETGMY